MSQKRSNDGKKNQLVDVCFFAAVTCGEVVCLRGEDDVSQRAPGHVGAGLGRISGEDALQLGSLDTTRKHIFHNNEAA